MMSKHDYKVYDLTISVLTPLHIGSGVNLLHEYDYAIHKGKTWRIDEAALLDAQNADDPRQAELLARTPPAQLLRPQDFHGESAFFRYHIDGTPRSKASGAQLQEQIKTVHDELYLPGSSLKGALRTAIAWYAWEKLHLEPRADKLNRYARFAAQNYERTIFGKNPNHDFMRALQVADSAPVSDIAKHLMVLNIRALNRSGRLQAPIEAEAIRPDTVFKASLKLDLALYSRWAQEKRLHLAGKDWLEALPQVVHAHTRAWIESEAARYRQHQNAGRLASFYGQLEKITRTPNTSRFLLQLGAGTGWTDKTFGERLKTHDRFMETILRPRREGGYGVARDKPPQNPQDFPLSRRVAVAFRRDRQGRSLEIPAYPLGWVLVEMKER